MKKRKVLYICLAISILILSVGCGDMEEQDSKATKTYQVNDVVEVDGWDITVHDYKFIDKIGEGMNETIAEEDESFLKVDMTVERTGSEGVNFLYQLGNIELKAVYDGEYLYSSNSTFAEGDLSDSRVEPLMEKTGYVIFTLPKKLVEDDNGKLELLIRTGDIIDLDDSGEIEETIIKIR